MYVSIELRPIKQRPFIGYKAPARFENFDELFSRRDDLKTPPIEDSRLSTCRWFAALCRRIILAADIFIRTAT